MKFPINWLTYSQRIQADVREALAQDEAREFFNESFIEAVATPIKQQEEWALKLLALQVATIAFLIVALVSSDAKISLFGMEIKNIQGIREVLLVFSSAIGVITAGLLCSRDAAIHVAYAVADAVQPKRLRPFSVFTLPTHFNIRLYIPREYDRWQFGIAATAVVIVAALCLVTMFCIAIAASIAVHWTLIRDIWEHPSLGRWSIAALVFVFCSYLFNLILLLRMTLPFPYADKSALKTWRRN